MTEPVRDRVVAHDVERVVGFGVVGRNGYQRRSDRPDAVPLGS